MIVNFRFFGDMMFRVDVLINFPSSPYRWRHLVLLIWARLQWLCISHLLARILCLLGSWRSVSLPGRVIGLARLISLHAPDRTSWRSRCRGCWHRASVAQTCIYGQRLGSLYARNSWSGPLIRA